MAEKYIVQSNSVTKIIYIGGCQSAKGGHKKPIEPADIYYQSQYYGLGYVNPLTDIEYEQLMNGVQIQGKYHEKNYRARKKSRRKAVEELILNNFEPRNSSMITLTFSGQEQDPERYEIVESENMSLEQEMEQMLNCLEGSLSETIIDIVKVYDPKTEKFKDLSHCQKLFKQFIQRMRYRFPLFHYVAVRAQQDNSNWHFHLVCNLNYIPFNELRTLWRHGAVYFRSFKQTGMNGLWKSIRYLQKNMKQAELQGEKGYLASKGLQRNKIYRSWIPGEQQQIALIEKQISGLSPSQKYETSHDYCGVLADGTPVNLTSTTKYFKFFNLYGSHFRKLPNAYISKKGQGYNFQ